MIILISSEISLVRYLLSFAIALLICYGSDISPYYLAFFSGGKISVIGSLIPFSVPCLDPPRGEFSCVAAYRIPHHALEGHSSQETLGLGIIIHSIEVSCEGEDKPPVVLAKMNPGGRMKNYYDTYQTIPLSALNCRGDILVKNWFKPSLKRHGYANGPATIGDPSWIERVKSLAEFFQSDIYLIVVAVFLMFSLSARSLKRFSYVNLISTPFETWSFYWLFFTIVMSDNVLDLILPLEFEFWMKFVPRLGYFFGSIVLFGPILTVLAGSKRMSTHLRDWSHLLVKPQKKLLGLSILVILSLALNASPYFSCGYRIALAIAGLASIAVGAIEVRLVIALFGATVLSDFGKTMMVPYLPVPRFTATYVGIVLVYSMITQIKLLESTAKAEGKRDLAAQVAHDIRSPLNSLSLIIPALSEISDEKRLIAKSAIVRIQEVANNLVVNYKRSIREYESLQECLILHLLEQIITEKKIHLGPKSLVVVEKDAVPNSSNVFCKLSPVQLIRALSNLIDNSIEAIGSNSGEVKVRLETNQENVFIIVSDSGPGIPELVLQKLGTKGVTSGKQELGTGSGSGLGIYHAKQVAEEWGGRLSIETELAKGTRVTIQLPRARPPQWFIAELKLPSDVHIIILDDDSSVHSMWDKRFQEVGFDTRKVHHYFKSDDLEARLESKTFHRALYLIDYHLTGSTQNGIEFIESHHIVLSSILVTHSFEEMDIRENCEKLGLKILPKILADSVPIILI